MSIPQSGTPTYLKLLNKKKVLQTIIGGDDYYSRASLAKELNISKPTISSLVDELVKEGWLIEKESNETAHGGGRKPVHLFFNKVCKYTIGVDIGGTHTEIAIMNLEGELIITGKLFTQQALKDDFIHLLVTEINRLLRVSGLINTDILSLAIGAPGITDTEKGIVIEAPSLQWDNYPLQEKVSSYFPFPVYIENDVNMAVLGEYWKGSAKDKSNVVLITIGTGVGCGIIINRELYRGFQFAAGEIGYMITNKDQAGQHFETMFDGFGFLENHVGGPAIVKQYIKNSTTTVNGEYSAEMVFNEAIQGETYATKVINEALDHIAVSLINVAALLNPDCIVLGGGISKSGEWFLPKLQHKIAMYLPKQSQTEVLLTQLPQVALIGATALCLRNHELFSIEKKF
ncbi:ROK family transcriptional regulator [Litchfieldia alkalitelluris]|uniref:ROK family transcriptional regulator n=1 Tax=Litchfieldia alkalitelluris TaxID=304268 RepID=UPI001473C521|nr:ROK family transcriptional regulator [Litchfieldia alkalitelluris]